MDHDSGVWLGQLISGDFIFFFIGRTHLSRIKTKFIMRYSETL